MRNILIFTMTLLFPISVFAQLVGDTTGPGDSCVSYPAGATAMVADSDLNNAGVILTCDGTNWQAVAERAAGSDGHIQFNSAGVLAGSSSLVYTSEGYLGMNSPTPGSNFDLQGNYGPPEPWKITFNLSDGVYGTAAAYNGAVGLYSFIENGAVGAGFTEAYSIFAEAQGTSDSKQQHIYGIAASVATYDTDIGHGINISDSDISTGGTIYGLYINLDDTDVTRYGIFQTTANDNYLAGNLGIGVSPTVALDVAGDIHYTGTMKDVSDIRRKENIVPLKNSLKGIEKLKGYSFTMKDDPESRVEYGVMAQEVEPVFPELVSSIDSDGTLSVNYIGLIPQMIEAIKELSARVDNLEVENSSLREQLNEIKN
jgi:hypothetical protein